MSGFRIAPATPEPKQRRPRKESPKHLDFIRRLPCCHPGCDRSDVHAAHIRAAAPHLGKRPVGVGEKPSDVWTVPLCGDHHLFGPDAQHREGDEIAWWRQRGIDPFPLALALYAASGDHQTAAIIIRLTKERAKR